MLSAALFGGCAFLTPTSPAATVVEGAWEDGADAPVALTEVAVAAHSDQIWVAGGLTGGGAGSTDVLLYDPEANSWTEGPALPGPVHHSALVSDGAALWLVGGYAGNGFDAPTADVWRLDPSAADGWVADEPLPEARGAGAAAWDGSRIVYAGGVGPDGVSGAVYAFEDGAWSQVARLAKPREHLAATSDGEGGTYVLGGRVGGLDANLPTADLVRGHDGGDDRRAADSTRRCRSVLVADRWRVPGRRGVTRRHERAGRVHRRGRRRRRCCRGRPAHGTGWAPRSSMERPMSHSAATSQACSLARRWSHWSCPDDRASHPAAEAQRYAITGCHASQ